MTIYIYIYGSFTFFLIFKGDYTLCIAMNFDISVMLTLQNHVVGDNNCPVTKAGWAESQSNNGVWIHTLLSRKSCVLTNNLYNPINFDL